MGAAIAEQVNTLVCEATSGRKEAAAWLVPLAVYFAIALPSGVLAMERLNSDGVCYLRRAILLLRGDYTDSVSAYWSPGLIWSTVPLLRLGVDPLHAIRWTLLIWGAIYVLAAGALFRTVLPKQPIWRLVAGAVVALTAVRFVVPTITPDILLGAVLMLYLAVMTRGVSSPRRALIAGLIGGVAYLAKAYALPFFIVHFLLSVACGRKDRLRTAGCGLLGFVLVAGPWMGVLSWKYGKPTFSTATARNRFMQDFAPADVLAHPPDVSRIPPGPFISNMEVTDADNWPVWSPFDSKAHFLHQMRMAGEHAVLLVKDVWRFDYVGLSLLAGVIVLLRWRRMGMDARFLLFACIIYGGGLLFVVYEGRYVVPVLVPIALALCLIVWESLSIAWRRAWMPYLILLPFVASAVWTDWPIVTEGRPEMSYREMARQIRQEKLNGVFVTNTANRDRPGCLAFFLDRKFMAMPLDEDGQILQSKLDDAGVRFLFRWVDPAYSDGPDWPEPQARALLETDDWVKRMTIHIDGKRRLEIFRRKRIEN